MKSVCCIVQNVYDFDPRVRRKAEALATAGYAVDVLALRPVNGQKSYTVNGVNVRTIALKKKRGTLLRYFFEYAVFFMWAFLTASLQMFRKRYAAIDVNSLPDFLIFAPIVAKWMGARLILDLHEITPEFYMSKYGMKRDSAVVRVLTYLEKVSVRFADHVITINEPIEDLLAGRGLDRSKSTVIMNAADEGRFANCGTHPPVSDTNKFVMMYHGTLTHIYGLDIAIEAFAQVHGQMPGAELWILGSGPEKPALVSMAEERGLTGRVKILGQVPAGEIPAWLSECHAGVLPIRRDVFLDFAFPNKLPELIITGKPAIISRLRAIRHYFSEDALGFFEPGNARDLGIQMLRLYEDSEARARMVKKAQAQYAPIRWEVMKARYLKVIEEASGPVGDRAETLDAVTAGAAKK